MPRIIRPDAISSDRYDDDDHGPVLTGWATIDDADRWRIYRSDGSRVASYAETTREDAETVLRGMAVELEYSRSLATKYTEHSRCAIAAGLANHGYHAPDVTVTAALCGHVFYIRTDRPAIGRLTLALVQVVRWSGIPTRDVLEIGRGHWAVRTPDTCLDGAHPADDDVGVTSRTLAVLANSHAGRRPDERR
jgi:hypothetical protein